jgi:asparagine synthase (glutamine-hydrolysing)
MVERMITTAPHRGERVESLVYGGCALAVGFTEETADAALFLQDGLAVAYCGVVDNLADVEHELKLAGLSPPSSSVEAILLTAFRAYGEELPRRLRGVFAVVVTDGDRIICFRDHLGFETLFYRHDGRGSYVASEAKQVVVGAGIPREPDIHVLERIYFQDLDDQAPAALRGVERLPKATTLTIEPHRARLARYWDPKPLVETARYPAEELKDRFDALMGQAVTRMLTGSDAVSLSGGIDSPAVAAYAIRQQEPVTQQGLGGLSAVFPDFPSVDEERYVRLVAEELGIPLHTYVQKARPLDRLDEWARLTDGPVPTISLPQYEEHYLLARKLGYRTVLTGELAEFVMDLRQYLIPHLLFRGRIPALAGHLGARRSAGATRRSLARQVLRAFVPADVVALRWRLRTGSTPQWLDRGRVNAAAAGSIVSAADRWRKVQLGAFHGPGISVEADAVCQALCGVKARRPWADVDLWEFFLSLPAEIKFPDNQSKTLVRRLLRGRVPDAILDRRDKTVFDESVMSHIDYDTLRRWLIKPDHRLGGVDYDLLEDRLERRELELPEFMWAKDLASVHAFLSLW